MEEKQLKVVILNAFQGSNRRGAETFVTELSKRLGDYEVLVLEGKELPAQRWPILWRAYLDPFGLQTFIFTLRQLVKLFGVRPDIVLPINGGWQPAIIRLFTWLTRSKMVISGQSGIGWDDRNNLMCFPDVFIATTKYQASWAKKFAPWVQVKIIPNGVDLERFSPKGVKSRLNLKKPVILAVGALVPEKHLDLTIKAVALIKNVSLLVVGSGPLKQELGKLAQKELRGRYAIISTTHERIPEVYRAADVFTLTPSPRESFGIVFLEAMATNLPVVTNNDTIRKEIVGNAGLFVEAQQTEKYAEALTQALSSSWDSKPREQSEKYSWDAITQQYEKLFRSLYK